MCVCVGRVFLGGAAGPSFSVPESFVFVESCSEFCGSDVFLYFLRVRGGLVVFFSDELVGWCWVLGVLVEEPFHGSFSVLRGQSAMVAQQIA